MRTVRTWRNRILHQHRAENERASLGDLHHGPGQQWGAPAPPRGEEDREGNQQYQSCMFVRSSWLRLLCSFDAESVLWWIVSWSISTLESLCCQFRRYVRAVVALTSAGTSSGVHRIRRSSTIPLPADMSWTLRLLMGFD